MIPVKLIHYLPRHTLSQHEAVGNTNRLQVSPHNETFVWLIFFNNLRRRPETLATEIHRNPELKLCFLIELANIAPLLQRKSFLPRSGYPQRQVEG